VEKYKVYSHLKHKALPTFEPAEQGFIPEFDFSCQDHDERILAFIV